MIFWPPTKERKRLPVIHRDAVGRGIELRDQVGIMRLLPRDRVRIIEHRDDHCLCEHAACKSGLLLIKTEFLFKESDAGTQTTEDGL